MLEISVTFEEFQLVFNFMLFFTLTLFFSIQEKYKVAKIWGAAAPPANPVSAGLLILVFNLLNFIATPIVTNLVPY